MVRTRIVLMAGLVLAIAFAVALVDRSYLTRIYPGVTAAGVDFGGSSESQARERLADAAILFADAEVSVVVAGTTWAGTSASLGIELDVDRAVAEAMAFGKSAEPLVRLRALAGGAPSASVIGWPRRVSDDRIDRFVAMIGGDLDRVAVNGDVLLTTGGVEVREPRDGVLLRRDQLRRDILAARSRSVTITPSLEIVPPEITTADIADARRDAVAAYRPVRFLAGSESVTVPAESMARLLVIDRVPSGDGTSLSVDVDGAATQALIDEVADQMDGSARDAVLVAGEDKLGVIPGRDRIVVDRPAATLTLREAIFTPVDGERQLRLPASVSGSQVTTAAAEAVASELRLAGSFTTYFPESPARARNIGLAADAFDGIVVAPGDSFSFWGRIGEVSPRTGYVVAGAIVGGVSQQVIGGGLCQVSTTLFNAVAHAGLRIDERLPHSYYIERYPLGLDAAVFAPSVDLKWTNDTDTDVRIFGQGTDTSVTFWLYSRPTGRTVSFSTPIETNLRWPSPAQPADPAHAPGYVVPGRDVWVTRVVVLDGVEILRDAWFSHYAPVWGGPLR
jgi:vancomycin resistance protein YoaR